jgi:uncharacterized protein
MPPLIEDNLEEIGRLCRLYGVRKLELFGSILRQDLDPEHSDVEFEPHVANSFANFLRLKEALERVLGRRVGLAALRATEIAACATISSKASRLSMPQRDPGVYSETLDSLWRVRWTRLPASGQVPHRRW